VQCKLEDLRVSVPFARDGLIILYVVAGDLSPISKTSTLKENPCCPKLQTGGEKSGETLGRMSPAPSLSFGQRSHIECLCEGAKAKDRKT
jgi:hypothetical protein